VSAFDYLIFISVQTNACLPLRVILHDRFCKVPANCSVHYCAYLYLYDAPIQVGFRTFRIYRCHEYFYIQHHAHIDLDILDG
jgi:hypothetical protein